MKLGDTIPDPRGDDAASADSLALEESPPPTAPAVGTRLGPYVDLALVGQGGMGAVYRATDERAPELRIAVKVRLPREDEEERPELEARRRRRFEREGRITADLHGPGVVAIHQAGRDETGRSWYAMDLVEGTPLDAVLDALRAKDRASMERFPLRRRMEVFVEVARTVGRAHSRGVLHRDIKPQNVMLDADGHAFVLDWGLAKDGSEADDPVAPLVAAPSRRTDSRLTSLGGRIGTPSYMPPEQATGDLARIGRESDVFGLGALLFELLFLRPPYVADTDEDLVAQAVRGTPSVPAPRRTIWERLRQKASQPVPVVAGVRNDLGEIVPAGVLPVLRTCLQKDAAARYPSATEVSDAVAGYLRLGETVKPPVFRSWVEAAFGLGRSGLRMTDMLLVGLPVIMLILTAISQGRAGSDESSGLDFVSSAAVAVVGFGEAIGLVVVVLVLQGLLRSHVWNVADLVAARVPGARVLAVAPLWFNAGVSAFGAVVLLGSDLWKGCEMAWSGTDAALLACLVPGFVYALRTFRRHGFPVPWAAIEATLLTAVGLAAILSSVMVCAIVVIASHGQSAAFVFAFRSLVPVLVTLPYSIAYLRYNLLAHSLAGPAMDAYVRSTESTRAAG